MNTETLRGSITALITPFKNGAVDEAALAVLVERQIAAGTHGLVPCGTTGESPTLSHAEHERVVELCIEAAAARAPASVPNYAIRRPHAASMFSSMGARRKSLMRWSPILLQPAAKRRPCPPI